MFNKRTIFTALIGVIALATIACEEGLPEGGKEVVIDGTRYVVYELTPTPVPPTPTPTPRPTPADDPVAQQTREILGIGEARIVSRNEFEVFAESARFGVTLRGLNEQISHPLKVTLERQLNAADWETRWALEKDVKRGNDIIQTRVPGPGTYRFTLLGIPDDMRWEIRIR